jgi:integrase
MAKLTDQFIRSLQVPEGAKDIQVFDEAQPGFGVRKQSSGHTSFFVKYSIGTQQRRKTLGPFVPGALAGIRKEAAVVLAQAKLGKDVVGEAKKAQQEAKLAKTLGELVPIYLEVREKGDDYWAKLRPRSLEEVTRYLTRSWQPLHSEPVNAITRQMVKDRRHEIVSESGPIAANRAHAALSGFFAWAIDMENVAGANPTSDIKALKQNKRTRVLSETELVEIWLACDDDDYGQIVKLLMLTGQRRKEIGHVEWSEFHTVKRQIELGEDRVKNKQPHIVPLSEPAFSLLQGCVRDNYPGRRYVFGPDGFVRWSWGKDRLDRRIAERRGTPLPHWTIHDVRRTVVTNLTELGFAQPHVAEAIVNHISGSKAGVAGVYNRATYLPEKREALEKWGRYLTGLVGGPLSGQQSSTREKSGDLSSQLLSGTRS